MCLKCKRKCTFSFSNLAGSVDANLRGEVPVEDALAVQVLESAGDVQSQAEPRGPRQIHVTAQQLLQVTAINVLDHRKR